MKFIQDSIVKTKEDNGLVLTQVTQHHWQGDNLPQLKVIVRVSKYAPVVHATCYAWFNEWREVISLGHSEIESKYKDTRMTRDAHHVRAMAIDLFNNQAALHYRSKYT